MHTPEEFQKQLKEKNITRWYTDKCTSCDHDIGFVFHPDGRITFNNDCCNVSYYSNWSCVIACYKSRKNQEIDEFWGFCTS